MPFIDTLPKIRGKYRENANVGKMCWFKTHSIADILFIPQDIDDLKYFLSNKPKDILTLVIDCLMTPRCYCHFQRLKCVNLR